MKYRGSGPRGLDSHDFASYLRRLADEVDAGRAMCDVVKVDRGDERLHEFIDRPNDRSYRAVMDTGETHELRVKTLRRVEVKRCQRCGELHEVGIECRNLRPMIGDLGDNWP